MKLIEIISNYSLYIEHIEGRDNHIAYMLLRNPDDPMNSPDIERNFYTIRRIRRVMTRSEAKGKKENFPRDLQVIAEKAKSA